MNIYKELLERGFKVIFYNNGNLDGYVLSSRTNYKKNLNLEKYEGVVSLIVDLLGRDKYFWLEDVDAIYIEVSESLDAKELYYVLGDKEAIDIKDKFEDILKLIPKEYECEFLE